MYSKKTDNCITFIQAHNPNNTPVWSKIKAALQLLENSNKTKGILKDTKFINSRRQWKNLGRMLATRQFTSTEEKQGCFKYDSRCGTCPIIQGPNITIQSTGQTFTIKKEANWRTDNVCNIYSNLFCMWQTICWWNMYMYDVEKESNSTQTTYQDSTV